MLNLHAGCCPSTCSLLQVALSRKYSSQHRIIMVELGKGEFAAFNGDGSFIATGPWEALQAPIATRPIPERLPQHKPRPATASAALADIATLLGI